jgi:Pectate lyase superfamily protein
MWRSAGLLLAVALPASAATYDVRQFGAAGDGTTKDTAAIQRAIDAAAGAGGGTVVVPAGRYLSGTIRLKSYVTLHLDNGASLLASPDSADFEPYEPLPFTSVSDNETTYFRQALILGENVRNIAITGQGIVDGNRTKRGGPKTIAIKLCQYVAIRGITVQNSPNYSISFWGTDFVDVDGVTILNGYSDGIDPDACRFVRIANTYIDCYDDAICPKASPSMGMENRRGVEHLTVVNCVLRTNCSNFKFGTESSGDLKNVAFSNVAMYPRDQGRRPISGIALESVDGANIDGVVISNVTMDGVQAPIFIRLGNRGRGLTPPVPGTVRNVSIQNVIARNATVTSSITGIPGHPVRRVTLGAVHLNMAGGQQEPLALEVPEHEAKYPEATMFGTLPSFGLYARHVDGLALTGLQTRSEAPDVRPNLIFDDLRDLTIDGLQAGSAAGAAPVVWMNDVADAFVRGARTVAADLFLRVTGARSSGIVLTGNDLSRARKAVEGPVQQK